MALAEERLQGRSNSAAINATEIAAEDGRVDLARPPGILQRQLPVELRRLAIGPSNPAARDRHCSRPFGPRTDVLMSRMFNHGSGSTSCWNTPHEDVNSSDNTAPPWRDFWRHRRELGERLRLQMQIVIGLKRLERIANSRYRLGLLLIAIPTILPACASRAGHLFDYETSPSPKITVQAQNESRGEWARLQSHCGETVQVHLKPGVTSSSIRGKLIAVDDRGLVVEDGAGRSTISLADVQEIATAGSTTRDSLWNGTLLGAAIGAGYALAIVATVDDVDTSAGSLTRGFAISTAIGAAAGAWIDSLKRAERTQILYRAK